MKIGTAKIAIKQLVEANDKDFLLKLWKSLSNYTFLSGFPCGRSYIDIRSTGDIMDYFFLWLDREIAEKYPELAGKYKREL